MKKLLLLFAFFLQFLLLQAQPQTFIYSKTGSQILFDRNDTIQYVHFVPDAGTRGLGNVLKNLSVTAHIDILSPEIYRCDLSGRSIPNFINYIENQSYFSHYTTILIF